MMSDLVCACLSSGCIRITRLGSCALVGDLWCRKGLWQLGSAVQVVWCSCCSHCPMCCLHSFETRHCISIKREQDYLAAIGCSFLFVILVSLLYAVCLAAWLAMTSAVVLMTARAMLQSVLRRSEHDNCSRAIVAAATRYLPCASLCMFVFARVCLPLRVLTAYDFQSCVCA